MKLFLAAACTFASLGSVAALADEALITCVESQTNGSTTTVSIRTAGESKFSAEIKGASGTSSIDNLSCELGVKLDRLTVVLSGLSCQQDSPDASGMLQQLDISISSDSGSGNYAISSAIAKQPHSSENEGGYILPNFKYSRVGLKGDFDCHTSLKVK